MISYLMQQKLRTKKEGNEYIHVRKNSTIILLKLSSQTS
jgi:hypothetical protein